MKKWDQTGHNTETEHNANMRNIHARAEPIPITMLFLSHTCDEGIINRAEATAPWRSSPWKRSAANKQLMLIPNALRESARCSGQTYSSRNEATKLPLEPWTATTTGKRQRA